MLMFVQNIMRLVGQDTILIYDNIGRPAALLATTIN